MKQEKKNIFSLVSQLKQIFDNKPAQDKMLREVEMMRFKIRPVIGDISILNFKNKQLIETLWGLGKLDEFFKRNFKNISKKDKRVFSQMVGQLRGRLEEQLSRINFRRPVKIPQIVEMEIFKEHPKYNN